MNWILLLIVVGPFLGARWSPWCLNVCMGWDCLGSAYTGGKPGETLSGRAGSAEHQRNLRGKIFAPAIDFLMWAIRAYPTIRGHCEHARLGDIQRAQAAIVDQSR